MICHALWRVVGFGFSVPVPNVSRVISARRQSTFSRRRPNHAGIEDKRRCTCSAMAPSRAVVPQVVKTIHELYGDAEDENIEFHRWNMAQGAIEESGLRQQMHSTELTYGEFSLDFFGKSLCTAIEYLGDDTRGDLKFVDIGSGFGRLAHFAACFLGEQWTTTGLEIVPGMVEYASEVRVEALALAGVSWPSRLKFVLGDYSETGGEAEKTLQEANILFCFCTTWPSGGTPFLTTVSFVLGQRLTPGSIVMTVDKQLATEPLGPDGSQFELLNQVDGENRCVGESTVYFYRFRRN